MHNRNQPSPPMDYLNIPGRNQTEWLPENCLQKAIEDIDPESDKVIPAIEKTLKKQGFDIPPFFVEICISIAAHEHGMTALDPVIIQEIVHIAYNNPNMMRFIRDPEKQEYMQNVFKGRRTIAGTIEAAKEMDT